MLRREDKISIEPMFNSEDKFEGSAVWLGLNSKPVFSHNDNYFIYMKNINFNSESGIITGRYLGEATDLLIDGYSRELSYQDGLYLIDGNQIKTARMVAVKNIDDKKIIVVIQ